MRGNKFIFVQGMDKLFSELPELPKQTQKRAIYKLLLNTSEFSCYKYCKLVWKHRKMMGKFYGIFSEVDLLLHHSPSPENISAIWNCARLLDHNLKQYAAAFWEGHLGVFLIVGNLPQSLFRESRGLEYFHTSIKIVAPTSSSGYQPKQIFKANKGL